ncbi:branched-chain amino acid ABC transporter permease [Gordonia sp. HNM0687]|uniref:Branched-chain amino acid ABC transporter permease n=1 Tax=Gordonia mangrovi TaxID=2665643 RepID=A0A6L7GZ67_9ACTN|nr:branched-chain amino acid ABC transporter permease [Gordonia mangrovi]MXP24238.1 branched-chain amino acid ABC transporter permease [Gordonia mangrovi]UVF79941.1 branched-chain amino acid ABC transporter permease [Gordonia mangrovi]
MQEIVNAAALGSIYLLFALGMALAWGTIGILNFAHGATFVFSVLVAHLITQQGALPLPVILVIAMAAGAALSVATQWLVFQRIVERSKGHRATELRIIIGGIGVSAIVIAYAQRETGSSPFGLDTSYVSQQFQIGSVHLSTTVLIILVAALGIGVGLTRWLKKSRQGLALRAIGVDAEVSEGMGVNRSALALGTMAVAGALAGLAGVLLTLQLGAIAPESGDPLLIKAFAIIVLGGLGSMGGAVLGAYILAASETLLVHFQFGTWVDAVSFGLIFLVLIFRPQGLFGRKEVRRT